MCHGISHRFRTSSGIEDTIEIILETIDRLELKLYELAIIIDDLQKNESTTRKISQWLRNISKGSQ